MSDGAHYLSLGDITADGEHVERGDERFRVGVEHVLEEDGTSHIALVVAQLTTGRWGRIDLSTEALLWLRNRLERGATLVLEDGEHAGSLASRAEETLSPA